MYLHQYELIIPIPICGIGILINLYWYWYESSEPYCISIVMIRDRQINQINPWTYWTLEPTIPWINWTLTPIENLKNSKLKISLATWYTYQNSPCLLLNWWKNKLSRVGGVSDFLKLRPTQSNLIKLGLELSLAILSGQYRIATKKHNCH